MRNALPMRLLLCLSMPMLLSCNTTTQSLPPSLESQIRAAHASQKVDDCDALATEHLTPEERADPVALNYAARVGKKHLTYCGPKP